MSKPMVRPLLVVVLDVFFNEMIEVIRAKDDERVEIRSSRGQLLGTASETADGDELLLV